jgi:hypothetical protein
MYCPINLSAFAGHGEPFPWPLDLVTTLAVAFVIAGALFLALWQVARHHGLPAGSAPII